MKKKKAARKPVRTKKTVRKTARKSSKAAAKRRPAAKRKAPSAAKAKTRLAPGLTPEKVVPGAKFLGLVEDYFAHVGVIATTLKAALAVGDTIRVKGHTTDVTERLESMQIEHQGIQGASKGDSVGIKISGRARKGDALYKL